MKLCMFFQGLRLNSPEIDRIRNADMKNKLSQKRLHLILDLDHTLLNSTMLFHMNSEEDYLKSKADSLQGSFSPSIIDFLILWYNSVSIDASCLICIIV